MKIYISSDEYYDFLKPRKVLHYQKIVIDNRYVLIVEIDDPLIGQKYGMFDNDVRILYLVNRFDENAFDMLKFPIYVYVLIKSVNSFPPSSLDELQNIAWACLYDNEEDAMNHKLI